MKTNDLTKQVLEYCLKSGHHVVRINNIPGKKYRKNNVTKGTPDILGCTKSGQALAIEIKNKDTHDTQSIYQQEFEDHYKKRGGIYILATKLEDVTERI